MFKRNVYCVIGHVTKAKILCVYDTDDKTGDRIAYEFLLGKPQIESINLSGYSQALSLIILKNVDHSLHMSEIYYLYHRSLIKVF